MHVHMWITHKCEIGKGRWFSHKCEISKGRVNAAITMFDAEVYCICMLYSFKYGGAINTQQCLILK